MTRLRHSLPDALKEVHSVLNEWQQLVVEADVLYSSGKRDQSRSLFLRVRLKRMLVKALMGHVHSIIAVGKYQAGEANPSVKLTQEQINDIRDIYASGAASTRTLASEFGIGKSQMWEIVANKSWIDSEGNPLS